MGRQVIKQPDDKYAVWSSMVDNFILINCQEQDIVNFYCEEYRRDLIPVIRDQIKAIDRNEKPHFQFTMTWDEALDTIRDTHGSASVEELKKEILCQS